jgi:hypothetical protein
VPANASGTEPPDGGAEEMFQPPHIYAMVPGPRQRDPQCQPLAEDLERAKDDPTSPLYMKPFQIPSPKMDAAWVQLYGCAESGVLRDNARCSHHSRGPAPPAATLASRTPAARSRALMLTAAMASGPPGSSGLPALAVLRARSPQPSLPAAPL